MTMPVTLQFYPHSDSVHLRYCLREQNFIGLKTFLKIGLRRKDFRDFFLTLLDNTCLNGGIFHFWGHSWEVKKYQYWTILKDLVAEISSRKVVLFLTNCQIIEFLNYENTHCS